MRYRGSDWLKNNVKDISPLGKEVADILGAAFRGIYHLDGIERNGNWTNNHYIEVSIRERLATYDYDYLSRLVIMCLERGIRMEVRPCNFTHIKLIFHKRKITKTLPFDMCEGQPDTVAYFWSLKQEGLVT